MLRSRIFNRFFKRKKSKRVEIIKYNPSTKFDLNNEIQTKIIKIDRKISENSKAMMEAQIVKFRSTFYKSNNLFDQIGKNVYKTKLEDSINWYQKQLKELYKERRLLQINQEKLKGIFWLNSMKRFICILLIGCFLFFTLLILISGFMVIIYLLPIILLILFGYFIFNKKY